MKIVDSKGNIVKNVYDADSNLSSVSENLNGVDYTTSYTYDSENKPKTTTYKGNVITNNYDSLGRLQGKVTNTGTAQINTSYEFEAGKEANTTTNRVSKLINNGNGIVYTYDTNGNIETITQNGKVIKYYYNELNELIREDNQVLNKTITNSYDNGGNILNKVEYAYTTATPGTATKTSTYTYGDANWKDKLTSFNDGTEKPVTYDAIGNPLTYNGYTYTWEEGRQLATMSGNGNTIAYKYNDSGIRTQKTVNGVTTTYHLVGDKVTFETNGTDNIYYTYDSNDKLVSMNLNGVEYYYVRNAQEDIIGLNNSTGAEVVGYSYDSWGKLISTTGTLASTVGVKNPYRYRGYRYDTETSLYYLQSRYYNADWGRFINGDNIAVLQLIQGQLLGANLFAYCVSNPIMNSDLSGYWSVNIISVRLAAALFNYAISYAIGGVGLGAIKMYIRRAGVEAAKRLFTRTLVSELVKWGARRLAWGGGAAVDIFINYLDIGTAVAKWLDSKDPRPNNKWLTI
ncbi:RHS repeat-associated core domain-containing protein [Clostridium estertheticum]|uniref:RHS repeat-associated core domain-containing protein n=1 Tax=Clostridium estertheticum TaxID=238834 RepID=UPI001CD14F1C|nr:RHS repeat-associated core domain-containing protein [Clostridium estertheticum]MBZ9686142.1 RHS repeat-associated core domain-containing protein [Clostridium estertheticum]